MGGRGMAGAAAIFDSIVDGRKEVDEILIGAMDRLQRVARNEGSSFRVKVRAP